MFAVMGETSDGVLELRRFPTREQAESHPVILARWNRVWIEELGARVARPPRTGRLPWTVDEPWGNRFTYLRDAEGARVGSLTGTWEERQTIISVLREKGIVG